MRHWGKRGRDGHLQGETPSDDCQRQLWNPRPPKAEKEMSLNEYINIITIAMNATALNGLREAVRGIMMLLSQGKIKNEATLKPRINGI